MKKLAAAALAIAGLLLAVFLIFALYLAWGYYQMGREFAAREKQQVLPRVDAGSVPETGMVREARTTACIKTRKKRLFWWVNIPESGKTYLCEWRYGFAGFGKGDEVTLIHEVETTDGVTDSRGYLVGRSGKDKDKASGILTLGIEGTGN